VGRRLHIPPPGHEGNHAQCWDAQDELARCDQLARALTRSRSERDVYPELIEECAARKGGRRSEKPRSAPQTELTEVSEVKSLERAQVMHAKAPWVQSNPLLRAKEIYEVLLHSMKTKLGAIEKL
jgi:hypothetical protein